MDLIPLLGRCSAVRNHTVDISSGSAGPGVVAERFAMPGSHVRASRSTENHRLELVQGPLINFPDIQREGFEDMMPNQIFSCRPTPS